MITKKTYKKMKKLISEYERNKDKVIEKTEEQPYFQTERVVIKSSYKYNPNYGDNRECECGHSYYRHFDSYENMSAVGCKYCQCFLFKEKLNSTLTQLT